MNFDPQDKDFEHLKEFVKQALNNFLDASLEIMYTNRDGEEREELLHRLKENIIISQHALNVQKNFDTQKKECL